MAELNAQSDPSVPPAELPARSDSIPVEDMLSAALRGWWLLAVLILLGGVVGMAIARFRPTVYETGFSILTSIDLTNTGEQTQFEEDLGMEAVGQLIGSANLYQRVAAEAVKEGIPLDAHEMSTAAALERRLGTWRMRLRGNDPARIVRIAAIWQKLAIADLNDAYQHARVADGLQRKQLSLEACLNQSTFSEPSAGQCSPTNLRAVQAQLRASASLISEERTASRGLTSGIIMDTAPQPILSADAVLYRQGEMIAAGALIGLILGVWTVQSGLTARWLLKKRG
jgi:hypothetical protein